VEQLGEFYGLIEGGARKKLFERCVKYDWYPWGGRDRRTVRPPPDWTWGKKGFIYAKLFFFVRKKNRAGGKGCSYEKGPLTDDDLLSTVASHLILDHRAGP